MRLLGSRCCALQLGTTLPRTTAASATTTMIATALRCKSFVPSRAPGKAMPTPPPLRTLPPAPPLPGKSVTQSSGLFGAATFKAPHEVLTMMVEFVPTFFVPMHAVASILSDEAREMIKGRGKAANFFRRYRFFFDLNIVDGGRFEVRLREDVQHPRRGAADEKFSLADIGENTTYAVVPEFVTSLDNIDSRADVNVNVAPVLPPPSLHVRLQERVPVLERLRAMIPAEDFVPLEEIAERIPEDILTHPYFDVQGGLPAIATKFPDIFQVVEGQIRLRPPELAPLALDDFSFETSPEPEVIAIVKKAVCASEIPTWVSVTGLYEQLSIAQRRTIKRGYKSFASFLRAHGSSLALSLDLLRVSHWIPPRNSKKKSSSSSGGSPAANQDTSTASRNDASKSPNETNQTEINEETEGQNQNSSNANGKEVVQYTQTHVLNELYDRFPRGKELSLDEFLRSVPEHLRASLPKNAAAWLVNFPQYFVIEGATTSRNPADMRIRRARDHAPIDIALQLYPHIPEEGIAVVALEQQLPQPLRDHVKQFGIYNIVDNLKEWLELLDGDLFRRKTMDELEASLQNKGASSATSATVTQHNTAASQSKQNDSEFGERNESPVGNHRNFDEF